MPSDECSGGADFRIKLLVGWRGHGFFGKSGAIISGRRRDPAMTNKETIDVISTVDSNVLFRLFDLNAIEFGENRVAGKCYMRADGSNEILADGGSGGSNSKVVNLSADVDWMAVKEATVKIALVRSGSEADTIEKNVVGKLFEEFTGFGMTL